MSGFSSDETEEIPLPVFRVVAAHRPVQQTMKVDFGAGSHVGRVRTKNQDHYAIFRLARSFDLITSNLPDPEVPPRVEETGFAMVVADGMGGMVGGERASILAIQTGIKLVLDSPKWAFRTDDEEIGQLVDRLRSYFLQVDAVLVRETVLEPSLTGMGTTLTVAYSVGTRVFVVHAGDSRVYLMRKGELRRLTRDHTLAQRLADTGRISAEAVSAHSGRHVLVNFAGGPRLGIEPEIETSGLENGDRVLLCTDGLTGMVADTEIAAVLNAHPDPQLAAHALIDRALEHGGRDNVTVLIARYQLAS